MIYFFQILFLLVYDQSGKTKIEKFIQASSDEISIVEVSKEFKKQYPDIFVNVPDINPIYPGEKQKISSGVSSKRLHPIYNKYKAHNGIDIVARKNAIVYAAADGIVKKSGFFNGAAGHSINIEHKYGFKTKYFHLSMIAVEPGEKVKKGQIIGFLGNSGSSTAPHLHYELWKNGKVLNPIYFIPK